MTRISTIAIVAIAGLTTPGVALAAPKPAVTEATAKTERPGVAKPQRYCVVDAPATGSHLKTRVCKTLDAWLAEGFDPRSKK